MKRKGVLLFVIAIAIPLDAQFGETIFSSSYWPLNITGVPFSATRITEHTKILANGTRTVNLEDRAVIYRDSAGRTRIEHYHDATSTTPLTVTIVDPVAGFRFELITFRKLAKRYPAPPALPSTLSQPPPLGLRVPQMTIGVVSNNPVVDGAVRGIGMAGNHFTTSSELLSPQNIEGVTAEGKRVVTTLQPGSVGNDREVVVTDERWSSRLLRISVLTKLSDPRYGDTTSKLIKISLADPDLALFTPPLDYTVE